jgi:hypothetical protein
MRAGSANPTGVERRFYCGGVVVGLVPVEFGVVEFLFVPFFRLFLIEFLLALLFMLPEEFPDVPFCPVRDPVVDVPVWPVPVPVPVPV